MRRLWRDAHRRHAVSELPFISVIMVVRNEEQNIADSLHAILRQRYPKDRMDVIVVDGMSNDRTREVIDRMRLDDVALRVLPNAALQRAHGLNIGVRAAQGDIICRIDARTRIDPTYLVDCVRALQATGADNVGGMQRPLAAAPTQEAIGLAMSHPFGVGGAEFRLGRRSGFVDTVYPGFFRRSVFDRVGLFDDTAAVISEDSDFNHRLRKAGGKVYLDSNIVVYYTPRETFADLWRLYFRYGGARAGAVLKQRTFMAWRQVVPPLFVLSLVGLCVVGLVERRAWVLLLATLGGYVTLDAVIAISLAVRRRSPALVWRLMLAFPCMHIAWGLGFWRRLLQRPRPGTYWGH